MKTALLLLAAYGLDRILGDPRWLPHPVVGMGKAIRAVERMLRLIRIRNSKSDAAVSTMINA